MKTSADGIGLIKAFEGCRLTAYKCAAGVLTIGYGHTGADVAHGLTITQDEADQLLRDDLERFEVAVDRATNPVLSQNQFDACVALAFNIGAGAFTDSTLCKKINAGDFAGAAEQFTRWNKANGKVLSGLVRRRAAERLLFLDDESWRIML